MPTKEWEPHSEYIIRGLEERGEDIKKLRDRVTRLEIRVTAITVVINVGFLILKHFW